MKGKRIEDLFRSATLVVGLMMTTQSVGAAINCDEEPADYQGDDLRSAPDKLWRTERSQAIDGELAIPLQQALAEAMDHILTKVGGASIAVAVPGEGIWFDQRGRLRADGDEDDQSALFQAASVTKSFIAAVALQLVAEGKLSLDQGVHAWFPDVPHAKGITIGQLLRHTHGVVSFNGLANFPDRYQTPQQTIELAFSEPLLFCPGAHFAYSNTGYAMLGLIIEQLEGKPLHQVLADRVIEPTALTNTALRYPEDSVSVVDGFASGQPVRVKDGYATPYAAGGLASNAKDLVRFWHDYLSGELIAMDTVRSQFKDMARLDQHSHYGAGVQFYDIPGDGPGMMLGHSGGIQGFTSVMTYIPDDNVFIVVMFNDQNVAAEAGLWALLRAIRDYRAEL